MAFGFDPYDAGQQAELKDIRYAKRRSRLPLCACCGHPIESEKYLDLAPFGLQDRACAGCVELHSRYMEDCYA